MYLGGFLVGFLSVGVLKTMVMVVSLWLLVRAVRERLGKLRPEESLLARPEYRTIAALLIAGIASFALSELTCAVEIYLLYRPTGPLRLVHSFASAAGAAMLVYACALSLDRRALHYFDESRHCAFVGICRGCPRRDGRTCQLHPLFFWGLAFLAVMAIPILFVPLREFVVDARAVALPWPWLNHFFDQTMVPILTRSIPHWSIESLSFVIPREMSLAEYRLLPAISFALALGALALSFVRRLDRVAFALACFAAGPLAYCYLEVAVYLLVPHVYLGSLGHEIAELIGLALIRSVMNELLTRPAGTPKASEKTEANGGELAQA